MAGVNKVILIGNLGADPEVRHLESGAAVAQLRIATSETYTDRNSGEKRTQTEWHNVVLWRGLAEIAEKYLNKGNQVYIEGRLRTRSYEQDGTTKYVTEIVGNNLTMLGGARKDNPSEENSAVEQKPVSAPTTNDTDQDDDLPF